MPINDNLEPVKLPMKIRFGEEPKTEFKNNLDSINVKLVNATSFQELREYLVPFLEATWAEHPLLDAAKLSKEEKDKLIKDCFEGKALPTALETINLVFLIEGISLQEVTHLLRYRTASFAADCSGDKWWSHKDALVPASIENSGDFYYRYKKLVKEAKKLYAEMIDSKEISIMDARYILPRCLSTFYFVRMNLQTALSFVRQRIDRQIQPETDNVIAYKIYLELLKKYPVMPKIDLDSPSQFYIKMARTGKATNLYFPESNSDSFEWNSKDFIYQKRRKQLAGTIREKKALPGTGIKKFTITKFERYKAEAILEAEKILKENKRKLEEEYEEEYEESLVFKKFLRKLDEESLGFKKFLQKLEEESLVFKKFLKKGKGEK